MFASCSFGAIINAPPPELVRPVEAPADLVAVTRGDIKPVKVAEGIVTPYSEGLSFRSSDAPLSAIYVAHGQRIAEGELLAELDKTSWLDRLSGAREELDHIIRVAAYEDLMAEIRIELCRLDIEDAADEREKTLAEISLSELLARDMNRRETHELDRDRLQTRIDALEAQKDNYAIHAPFDGVVLHIEQLTEGDYPSGRTPFIFIADLNRLTIRCINEQTSFFTSAVEIIAVIGEESWPVEIVAYTLEEQLAFFYEGVTPPARFSFTGAGDAGSWNAPPTDKRVLLMAHERGVEDVVIIPINAAHIESSNSEEDGVTRQDFAYVDRNGVRERRDIKCGRRSDIWIEVIEGLSEGEIVYVDR